MRPSPERMLDLPWFTAFGEPTERVLHVHELETWAALRRARCGCKALREGCPWCQGTIKAAETFGQGNLAARVFPRT